MQQLLVVATPGTDVTIAVAGHDTVHSAQRLDPTGHADGHRGLDLGRDRLGLGAEGA